MMQAILRRSTTRGILHLGSPHHGRVTGDGDAFGTPRVEFLDGEGPSQLLDQIEVFAIPRIRRALDSHGCLLWQDLDLATGTLRRHRTPLDGIDPHGDGTGLEFELCTDDRGIQLFLDAELGSGPWVSIGPQDEPSADQTALVGWSVALPELRWRALRHRHGQPVIEVVWSCEGLNSSWRRLLHGLRPQVDCRLSDGLVATLSPRPHSPSPTPGTEDGRCVYSGYASLPDGGLRATRWITLEPPLTVVDADEEPRSPFTAELTMTLETYDLRAHIGGRMTRLVADGDLGVPIDFEIHTRDDVLLPLELPAGTVPGVPWDLAVSAVTGDTGGSGTAGGTPTADPATRVAHRRWRLHTLDPAPGTADELDARGCWRDLDWASEDGGAWSFVLGAPEHGPPPCLRRIDRRRAAIGWALDHDAEDEWLCLATPCWSPSGSLHRHYAFPLDDSFDYTSEVTVPIADLAEPFAVEAGSELPSRRLFLGPRDWRWHGEGRRGVSGPLEEDHGSVALGELGGSVRWRHPSTGAGSATDAGGARGDRFAVPPPPTDWAGGSAPVLLLDPADPMRWGGLYAPSPVPWEALEPVSPVSLGGNDLLLVPGRDSAALWIDLWGYVDRYDRRETRFSHGGRRSTHGITWINGAGGGGGLRLFPEGDPLLRSFSPVYAVRDPSPHAFILDPGEPRPTLRLGHRLIDGDGPKVLEIGPRTFVRWQVGDDTPPTDFQPGRIPGSRFQVPETLDGRTLWLTLEQLRGDRGRGAGYVLSWNATAGWRFRGFFIQRDEAIVLGSVGHGPHTLRIHLAEQGCGPQGGFRLTYDGETLQWSDQTPETVRQAVGLAEIQRWQDHRYFDPQSPPQALVSYDIRPLGEDPWTFELFEGVTTGEPGRVHGLGVWEVVDEVGAGLHHAVRHLLADGESVATGQGRPQAAPRVTSHPAAGPAQRPAGVLGSRDPSSGFEPSGHESFVSPPRQGQRFLRDDDDDGF